jgi:hypothetical protein
VCDICMLCRFHAILLLNGSVPSETHKHISVCCFLTERDGNETQTESDSRKRTSCDR